MGSEYLYETILDIDDVFIEEAERYRKNRRWHLLNHNVAAAFLIISFLSVSVVGVNAATNGWIIRSLSDWFGAELISSENEDLIGKEVNDMIQPEIFSTVDVSFDNEYEDISEVSHVISAVNNKDIVLPLTVSEFEVKDSYTPEIIITNGSMAVFYQNNYEGWYCEAGDILKLSFGKHESEVISEQTLVIGYIKDGILFEGEPVKDINGEYELKVEESGSYNLYIISATSDYLSLKQGTIKVEH